MPLPSDKKINQIVSAEGLWGWSLNFWKLVVLLLHLEFCEKHSFYFLENLLKTNILMCVCVLSHVWLFETPMDCNLPGFSAHEISQTRTLEWGAISFSGGSSWPSGQSCVSCISYSGRWILYPYILVRGYNFIALSVVYGQWELSFIHSVYNLYFL